MSTLSKYETVDISNILNYVENPRHDVGSGEMDTIKKLINKVGTQYMYNLAKDIYENGLLSPNLPTLVYDSKTKKYVVYEGNRRVACIKILENPNILTSIDKSLQQRIENLKRTETAKYSTKIHCYITNEEEALVIMERTHSGEDRGRGLKAWTAKEKGVFVNRIKNKASIELIIAELNSKYLNEDITEKIGYTTIKRFFNNREVKKALQISGEDASNISKEKLILINYLIDKAIEEAQAQNKALTRLFNRAREIEDFFVPLIEALKSNTPDKEEEELKGDKPVNREEKEDLKIDDHKEKGGEEKEEEKQDNKSKNNPLNISINKDISKNTYYTNQTIELGSFLQVENAEMYNPEFLEIESSMLKIESGIIQPNNIPGPHNVTFKYYMDSSHASIYWQDSVTVNLKPIKTTYQIPKQNTVLSESFLGKYYERLEFEYSDKIKALMYFLAKESKDGKYSVFINIVSRMFLEYTFRIYAAKVLKEDNQSIDNKSKSLQGFIDYCCNKIELKNPEVFVKHIQKGRKEATSKVEILQKSVHYFDVTISNEDIQVMFKNLSKHLEYAYDQILEAEYQTNV